LLQNRVLLVQQLIVEADTPEITTYAIKLVGKMTTEVHWSTRRPICLPKSERDPTRMPTLKEQNTIFARDGWRCRFCDTKVINKSARSVLTKAFSIETHWTSLEFQQHSSLYAMASSLLNGLMSPHHRWNDI